MKKLVPVKRKNFLYYIFREDKERTKLSTNKAEALRKIILDFIKNYF
jgi:hypothetical protein